MALPAMHPLIEEQSRPITFEEYRALPDDGPRYELIYGELIMAASPRSLHQRVAFRLALALQEHVDSRELGEVFIAPFDVRLSEYSAVQPDILLVSVAHKERIGDDYCEGAPDLVVEVVSPSNKRIDLIRKRVLYAEHGVPEYWIVDPEARSIRVNLIDGEHYAERGFTHGDLGSAIFPDLAIDVASVFNVRPWMSNAAVTDEDQGASSEKGE